MIIDTHAHLYFDSILTYLDEILDTSLNSGVEKIIAPSVDISTAEIIINLSDKYDMVYGAIGFHPCDISKIQEQDFKTLESFLKQTKIKAIGEIGLDYYWDTTNIKKQKNVFERQLEIAKQYDLPVIIHTRNSISDAIEIISKDEFRNLKCQFHCFSGTKHELDLIQNMENKYVSFCGNITFKKFTEHDIVINTSVKNLLFETDSPFLTPEPFRGKTNDPSKIIHTIKKISDIKNISENDLMNKVYQNTITLFNL